MVSKWNLATLALTASLVLVSSAEGSAAYSDGISALGLAVADSGRRAKKPNRPGIAEHSLESGGMVRRYLSYVSESHANDTPMPVVVDFHGSGSDPREEMRVSGMARAAERAGFILLMPVAVVGSPGGGHTWNVPPDRELPDDVRFTIDLLDHAATWTTIDPRRLYVTGFSGGARLASEVACALPDRIAALGAVGGLRAPRACPGSPVPVIAFHGTQDPINAYGGGGPAYWTYGVDEAVARWASRNGCASRAVKHRVSPSVMKLGYPACRQGAEVVLYRIEGAGHTWPGSEFPFPEERFGKTPPGLDATGLMLEFFARHAHISASAFSEERRQ